MSEAIMEKNASQPVTLGQMLAQAQNQRKATMDAAQAKEKLEKEQQANSILKQDFDKFLERLRHSIMDAVQTGKQASASLFYLTFDLVDWNGFGYSASFMKWGSPVYDEWKEFEAWLAENGMKANFYSEEDTSNEGGSWNYGVTISPLT